MTPIGTKTVIIIGAGVVGAASAYVLARKGYHVKILERRSAAGLGASYANGAQLSYNYTDALAGPGLLTELPRIFLGLEPTISVRPSIDPAFIAWAVRFLGNCTARKFRANTLASMRLALASQKAMNELVAERNIEFRHNVTGKMHLYSDAASFEKAAAIMEIKAIHGGEQSMLSRAEAISIEPAIAGFDAPIAGVIHSPGDAVGDSRLFSENVVALLMEKYESETYFKFDVIRIQRRRDKIIVYDRTGNSLCGDQLVLCVGVHGGRLLKRAGITLPILPMKGYSFSAPAVSGSPAISITDMSKRFVMAPLGDEIRVAGMAELGDANVNIDPVRMDALISLAHGRFPKAAEYSKARRFWAGLRPMTPDSLPRIGRANPVIAYNVGHGMLGWTTAMGSAIRLAELLGD